MVSWLGYCCYVPLLRFLIQYTSTTAERTSQRLSPRVAFGDHAFVHIAPADERQQFQRRFSNCLWGSSVDDNGGRESGSLSKITYSTELVTAVRDLSIVTSPDYGKDLANLFAEELHQLRGRDIAEAMFLAVKVWKNERTTDIIRRNLRAIATRLKRFPVNCWRCKDIAFMLYAMQSVRNDDVGAIEFINVMIEIVQNSIKTIKSSVETKHVSQAQILSTKDFAMILYGLQGFRSDNKEVCRLLSVLTTKAGGAAGALDTAGIGQCLYGLQSMSSDRKEVRDLVAVLTHHIQQSDSALDAQAVSNSLYGMKMMNSDHVEVRTLLSTLSTKIKDSTETMSAQELSSCLSGLRMMRSDYAEVRFLLQVLVPKILECKGRFTGLMLSDMLYGLQGMSSEHLESLSLFSGIMRNTIEHQQPMTATALSRALHGLRRADTTHLIVRQMIEYLTRSLIESPDIFTADNIGMALHGMQHMSAEYAETRSLLLVMQGKMKKCCAHPESLDRKKRKFMKFSKKDLPRMRSTAISNALYGLQSMSSTYAEVRQTLFVLTPLLRNCADDFSSKSLSNALYGLQCMSSEHKEVLRILSSLQEKVLSSTALMSADELGCALYGLRSMSCMQREVADVVACFVPKIEACDEIFTSGSLANALSGLQCMKSDSSSVRNLLSVLAPKIQRCTEPFSAEDVSRILHSLGGMSTEHCEVRTLLLVLVLKIKNCPDTFTAKMASRAINGLQGMSIEYIEVRTILFALIPKVKGVTDYFTAKDVSDALFGMQKLFGKIEAQSLVEYLLTQVLRLSTSLGAEEFHMLGTEDVLLLYRHISFALLNPAFGHMNIDHHAKWLLINNQLRKVITDRAKGTDAYLQQGSQVQPSSLGVEHAVATPVDGRDRILSVICSVLDDSTALIFSDTLLLNMFESDIVLQVPVRGARTRSVDMEPDHHYPTRENMKENKDVITINIEIEGRKFSRHENPRYTLLRDNYLKSQGVYIVRVRSTDVMNAGTLQLSDWLMRMVDTLRKKKKLENVPQVLSPRPCDDVG